ncbi:MAG: hypothetical protein CMN28_09715 [Salinisphaeraceae bacterium]|nr:hypothetical protein [Salinisphaeraceae bacterium]
MKKSTGSLWLCLHLPRLALDALMRGQSRGEAETCIAIADTAGNRRTLICVNNAAAAAGLQTGLTATTARSLVPGLIIRQRRLRLEALALHSLAGWCQQYTAFVHLPGPPPEPGAGRLLLEVGGSRKLFGDLARLHEQISRGLQALGYDMASGGSRTPEAAMLRARSGSQKPFSQLPLGLLELPGPALESLQHAGLKSIGEVLALPRDALARRHGPACLAYLDRLTGRQPDPLTPWRSRPRHRAIVEFPGAVENTQALIFPLRRLLDELQGVLRGRDAAIQSLTLTLSHPDHPATQLPVKLAAPSRAARHLESLLREKLDALELKAPVDGLQIDSGRFVPYSARQGDLFDSHGAEHEAWATLLDRLRNRLGHEAAGYLHCRGDHRPERASQLLSEPATEAVTTTLNRPVWFLPRPEALAAQPNLLTGPERIEAGWWQREMRRDYFMARDAQGRRMWVYRDLTQPACWYVHGYFG